MAKYYGMIGFAKTVEKPGSIWEETVTEHPYYGDVLRNARRFESSDKLHDDFVITNEFSIVADAFAYENFGAMRYITYMGSKWEITSATIDRPRITINIGGVYSEQAPDT